MLSVSINIKHLVLLLHRRKRCDVAKSVAESFFVYLLKMSVEIGKVATVELIRELEKRLRCSEIKAGAEK